MRPVRIALVGAALLVACDRPTQEPTAPQSTGQTAGPMTAPPVIIQNPACTHRWANPVNGSWDNPAMWSPAAVPGAGNTACVDAAGTYTVTLNPSNDAVPVVVDALTIGGASGVQTVQIAGTAATVTVAKAIEIGANGVLGTNTSGATRLTATTLVNLGTFKQTALCGGCGMVSTLTADLVNNGLMDIVVGLTLDKPNGTYQNLGTLRLTGSNPGLLIPVGAGATEFRQDGGGVEGGFNAGLLSINSGTYYLNGGAVGSQEIGNPVVRIENADLIIGPATTTSGHVAFRSRATPTKSISGNVPAQLKLTIMGGLSGAAGEPPTVANFSGATVVKGVLFVDHALGSGFVSPVRLAGVGPLTIDGSLDATPTSNFQTYFSLELINNGTMTLAGRLYFDRTDALYRNAGTIDNGLPSSPTQLYLIETRFLNTGSVLNGTIFVQKQALLTGTGSVGSVRVETGGQVSPGNGGTGQLRMSNYFSPDNTGSLVMEVGGRTPGVDYDQLLVDNQMTYTGTLFIKPVAGSVGGLCGQVFVLVEHHSPGGSSEFPSVVTDGLAAGHAFRLKYVADTDPERLLAYGYNPDVKVGVSPSQIALTEGQPGVRYAVCLGSRPGGSVTVTPSFGPQVTVSPASLVYTGQNYDEPQFFTVTAVDDGAVEGIHAATVGNTVTGDAAFVGALPPIQITITDNDVAPNGNPVAVGDAASTSEDQAVDVAVLGNDSDPDGNPVIVSAVSQGAHGSVSIVGTQVRYTPAADYNGTDSFGYTIDDGSGGTASATVTVTIAAVNDAPVAVADQATTGQGQPVLIAVLGNDSDIDGGALAVASVTQGANGAVTIVGSQLRYAPNAGFSGSDGFSYTVSDGNGGVATAAVQMSVTPAANGAPNAVADQATTVAGTAVTLAVLGNDSDPDGDALTVTGVTQPAGGTVTILPGGQQIRFTPNAGVSGVAQFSYTVSDEAGETATAVVQVTITGGGTGVAQRSDLALSVRGPSGIVDRRQQFALAVTVRSQGPVASTGATLRSTLPAGLTYVGASGATCTERTRILTCQVAGIAVNGRADVSLTFVAEMRGIHPILLNVLGTIADQNLLNNTTLTAIVVR